MNLLEYANQHLLFLDGGMGTLLQKAGLCPGELPEVWNLTHPEEITRIHTDYLNAGSHVISTNTFGANLLKFSPEELDRVIGAAVQNARRAQAATRGSQPTWVALDVGPTGRMLAPYGDFDFEDAVATFAATVRLGVKHGVDLIFIETMNDSYETKAALLAAKESCSLPVFVSNAYGADGKLMTGASPAAMVALLEGLGADAIGVNCSLGPRALAPVVEEYLAAASVPVLLKPNAGLPRANKAGETVYDVTPADFAREVTALLRKGVRMAGGCCGTTPAYIQALTDSAADLSPLPILPKEHTRVSSYTHAVTFGERPLLIGERINPTGKKRFQEALRAGDMDYLLNEGLTQEEKGVDLLDVNVGLPEIDEPTLLTQAVCRLQAILDLPLQIDTANPRAMERALRRYNGKALINSVSGKQESMDTVFPLAKKYGGVIIALTLDENGIPPTAEGRLAIAEKILAEATRYGIPKKDLVFDPLALTVSADPRAAIETLSAVEAITRRLGCHTSLGVSNVSFGLPQRDAINSTYFAIALSKGLSAAIMNPYSTAMMSTYRAFCALNGQDENCAAYVDFATSLPANSSTPATAAPTPAPAKTSLPGESELQYAIGKGLKERAAALTRELLQSKEPLQIVNEEIIPALNAVGEGFERHTVYLPQLLMSAEAAQAAFACIKEALQGARSATKSCFVLATVKGDIHDIGKNIVKLLLENYDFDVIDLGRDVPPEVIVQEVVSRNAPLVGLSALMTTTVPAMEETIRQLRAAAPWCRILVGGAVLTQEYANTIGADAYAKDAMEAVRCAEQLLPSSPKSIE